MALLYRNVCEANFLDSLVRMVPVCEYLQRPSTIFSITQDGTSLGDYFHSSKFWSLAIRCNCLHCHFPQGILSSSPLGISWKRGDHILLYSWSPFYFNHLFPLCIPFDSRCGSRSLDNIHQAFVIKMPDCGSDIIFFCFFLLPICFSHGIRRH
jgi:hypothetical protein